MASASSTRTPHEAFALEVRFLVEAWTIWTRLFEPVLEDALDPVGAPRRRERNYRITGDASEPVFRSFRWSQLRGVLIDLARLGDRLESCGQPNLTLERVFDATIWGSDVVLRNAAAQARDEALAIIRGPEMHGLRNKYLAHLDLDVATGAAGMPSVELEQIRLAVAWIEHFAGLVELANSGRRYSVQDPPPRPAGVDRDGIEAEVDRVVDLLELGSRTTKRPV